MRVHPWGRLEFCLSGDGVGATERDAQLKCEISGRF